jgi:CheY-like chemotaxis protein
VTEVLVADDENAICMALKMALEQKGFKVTTAHNGREALRAICAKSAEGQTFDAIILDIVMPDVDGWEVLRALQNNPLWKHTPTVVISGYARDAADYSQVSRFNAILVEKREDFIEVVTEVLTRVVNATPSKISA